MSRRVKKMVKPVISFPVRFLAGMIYEFAISSMIPMIIVLFTPGFSITWGFAKTVSVIIGLITASVILLIWQQGKVHKALMILGLMTLFPGLLALFFTWINPETLFSVITKVFRGFVVIEPLLEDYISVALPKARIVMLGYVLAGLVLIWVGQHLQK